MSDFAEDRAHEMGRPGPENEDLLSEREFADMLRTRMYLDTPRRTHITEKWLVDQDARRRSALRDLEVSNARRIWAGIELLVVSLVAMATVIALFAGLLYAAKALWEML
jgi:hypothetical protein